MNLPIWYPRVCKALLAAFCLTPAAADTVYSNPHPVPAGTGWSTWASTRATNGDYSITYDSFTVAETVIVTHVSWVGCYVDHPRVMTEPPTPITANWEFNFHANNGGLPGAQVYSAMIPVAQASSVFVSNESVAEIDDPDHPEPVIRRHYTAALPTPALLEPGTYWFSPRSIQAVFEPHFSWMPGAPGGGSIQMRNLNGGLETINRDGNRAFTIIGHPPPTEPAFGLVFDGTLVPGGGSHVAADTNQGSERTIQVMIVNPDAVRLQGISASITPPGNADFRIGQQPPSTLDPEDSPTFTVIFSPQGIGNRTGTLQVTSDDPFGPYIVHLSGQGGDVLPPVISPQASALTIVDGAAGNTTTVNTWLSNHGGASATDNSGTVTWGHNFSALPPNAASTTVTFTAEDAAGNEATTTAAIDVLDQTPPAITTQPTDLQVVCDDPDRGAQITAWLASQGGAAATDNSASFTWSHNYTTQPGPCGNVTVTFTAKDPSNNSSAATAKIFVLDTTAPAIGTPAVDLTVESNGAGNVNERNAWLNNHGGATATDNCSAVTTWTHDFTSLPNNLPQTVPVTFTTRDTCSNPSTTTASFIIQDTTPPQVTVQAKDFYGDCHEAAADLATFLNTRGGASATDIAGPITWSNDYDGNLPACEGYIVVTFTATDTVGLTASTSSRFFLFPPGAVWIGPATGAWSTAASWRSQVPHSGLDAYVDLFDFQNTTVTVTGTSVVKSLYIGAGDELVHGASSFTIHGPTIRNAGILRLRVPGDLSGNSRIIYLPGPISLEGSGKTMLTGPGRNVIDDTTAAGIVTVGTGHEITTTAETTASYQHTSIHAGIVNHGTVTADGGGLTLYSAPKTNHALFRAINGGFLDIEATVNNTDGTLFAGPGSTLHLESTLTGGTVTGTGQLLIDTNAGLTGPITLDSGLTTALHNGSTWLTGTITHNGVLNFGSATGTDSVYTYVNGPVTLEGSGKVVFQNAGRRQILRDNNLATDVLTLGSGIEITTSGPTDANYQSSSIHAGVVNHGTITADGGQLSLYSGLKTNHGLFRAINGGFLDIESDVINTGATLFAGPGSTLHLESTLTGGSVTGTGKLLINTDAALTGPIILDSGLTTAVDAAGLWLTGTISHDGLLTFGSAGGTASAYMFINGPVTLEGSGKVIFQNLGRRQILPDNNAATDVLTLGSGIEITTSGPTDSNYQNSSIHAGVINHGTITANQGQLSLYSQPKTNHGLIRAINGGFLNMQANVINTDATLFAGPGSTLYADATITGGTITGTGQLLFATSGDLVGPITLDAGLTTNLDNQGLGLTGDVTLNGVLNFGSATSTATCSIYINGPVNLQGSGKVIFRNAGRRQILYGAYTDHMLTVGPGIEITTDGRTGLNYQSSALHAPMINHGTVTVNGGGLTIYAGPKTNHGTFRAINGGYMDFLSVTVTNYNATTDTLTGGRWEVVSAGPATTMDFSSLPVVTLAAGTTVRLSGANASLPQLSTLRNISGTLMLENGKTQATSGNMAITGVLEYGLPAALETTRLAVTGNMDFTGSTIHIRDLGLTSGSYLLASWTGSVTGTPTLGSLPSGSQHSLVLNPVAKTLRLEVTVIQRPSITSFTTTPADESGPDAGKRHVHLAAQGQADTEYRLEASEELELWLPVSPVLMSSPTGALEWEFLQEPGFPSRFYRFEPE